MGRAWEVSFVIDDYDEFRRLFTSDMARAARLIENGAYNAPCVLRAGAMQSKYPDFAVRWHRENGFSLPLELRYYLLGRERPEGSV